LLRKYLRDSLSLLLATVEDNEVTVNGDLFDGFTVDVNEVVFAYELFADWMRVNDRNVLNLCRGNHDWNPRGDKLSSFHLLCHFLKARFGDRVQVFDKGFSVISGLIYSIPHMPNQELFNIEIEKAIDSTPLPGSYLLLHCNYKNGFAENSDHSLNINDDQVGALMRAGWTLVLGHEHQGYSLRGGRIVVVGNQFPSSIADCLGENRKFALRIKDDGNYESVETWESDGNFLEIDWHELDSVQDAKFIRVTGTASAEESATVVGAIATLRQKHDAFVITNAVKVAGHAIAEEATMASLENVRSYNVMDAIMSQLDDEEQAVVRDILGLSPQPEAHPLIKEMLNA